jgi:uncharacterized membrane protein YedE/YeeE
MRQVMLDPWAPWASGIVIGLMVPALYVIVGRRFGISSSLRHLGAICMPNAKPEYLRLHNWKDHSWNLVFVGGLLLGSFAGAQYLTTTPLEILPPAAATVGGLVRLALGGVLVGFGTRYAGGCTSGHTITGIASLNVPSMVATAAFFAGGLLSTWVLTFLIF